MTRGKGVAASDGSFRLDPAGSSGDSLQITASDGTDLVVTIP